MTPDMIKTKIMNGEEVDIPTTGRPVLVTPTGPISMRNMRKEPTQEELVGSLTKEQSTSNDSGERVPAPARPLPLSEVRVQGARAGNLPKTHQKTLRLKS